MQRDVRGMTTVMWDRLRRPILSRAVASRTFCWALLGLSAFQLITTWLHFATIDCAIHQTTGTPCPGCGLSRGTAALLRGDIASALTWHGLAPLAIVIILVLAGGAMLPRRGRLKLVLGLRRLEEKFAVGWMFAGLLWCYWMYRLLVEGETYIAMFGH